MPQETGRHPLPCRWARVHGGRHRTLGPGPRDRVRPDSRGPARRPVRCRRFRLWRYRRAEPGRRHRRRQVADARRHRAGRCGRQDRRQGAAARRPFPRGRRSRISSSATALSPSPAPTAPSPSSSSRAAPAKRRGLPDGLPATLDDIGTSTADKNTFPNGCHVCEVEIDPETGASAICRYTVADDFGRVVNPMIVAGQIHGGIVQGIGQALMEEARYDPESGQLLSGSLMDYAMPRAGDIGDIAITFNEVPCTTNVARHQGRGRGRFGRLAGGGDERGARRAGAARRDPARHAGVAAARVGGDRRRRVARALTIAASHLPSFLAPSSKSGRRRAAR